MDALLLPALDDESLARLGIRAQDDDENWEEKAWSEDDEEDEDWDEDDDWDDEEDEEMDDDEEEDWDDEEWDED